MPTAPSYRILVRIISTVFFVGYLPLIPGTFGSLAGLGIYLLVRHDPFVIFALACGVSALGFWASDRMEGIVGKKDASCIVIDEVSGIFISFLFVRFEWRFVILGFFLFRLFDTLKPYPAGRLQRLRGGNGIMIDDIIAGIYTNLVLQAVIIGASAMRL
jgi:phosphatidylglycerophosphatase A